ASASATGLPSTVTPASDLRIVAGVSSTTPFSATRPSAIMRSTSRREAIPARANNFAIRWSSGVLAGGIVAPISRLAGERGIFCTAPASRALSDASVTTRGRNEPRAIGVRAQVFGNRKRVITRLLIVEDEPLVAFDTEYSMVEHGFEVAAT